MILILRKSKNPACYNDCQRFGTKDHRGRSQCRRAKSVIEALPAAARNGNEVNEQLVNYSLSLAFENRTETLTELDEDMVCRTVSGKPVKPKTHGQKNYVDMIRQKMIVFGLGPAGTGKRIWPWRWPYRRLRIMKWEGSF